MARCVSCAGFTAGIRIFGACVHQSVGSQPGGLVPRVRLRWNVIAMIHVRIYAVTVPA